MTSARPGTSRFDAMFASAEGVNGFLRTTRNWGRWGADDQLGAANLISPEKRLRAAHLVRSGRVVSLSRPLSMTVGPDNPRPIEYGLKRWDDATGAGAAMDKFAVSCHSTGITHFDALCHMWGPEGMWNGRMPNDEISTDGSRWSGVEQWKNGIVTRGVLLDVPRHRGVPCVTPERPVTGAELSEMAAVQGISIEPGDALVIFCGRGAWDGSHSAWGSELPRPGLDVSCLRFFRESESAVVVWDMMDAKPDPGGMTFPVHSALWAYGVGMIDSALLEPLAEVCAGEARWEFLLVAAPLALAGGTGSPVNPLALF